MIMKSNKKSFKFNFIKGIIALAFSGLVGNILYFLVFRNTNGESPEGAWLRTGIFSLLIFALSVYVFFRIEEIPSKNEKIINEKQALKDAFKDANYELDYKGYFKEVIRTRFCGYYLAAAVWQIPLILNYVIAKVQPGNVTIYEIPVWIYEWHMPSLFAYEFLGSLWFLGFFLYLAIFIPLFTWLVYESYKPLLVKPSYLL